MNGGSVQRRGGRAGHSVLAPHFEAIRQWRRQRRTWKEIAALLQSEKGIVVTLHAPYLFMRRRLARGRHWEESDEKKPAVVPIAEVPAASSPAMPRPAATSPRSIPALQPRGFQKPDRQSFDPDTYL